MKRTSSMIALNNPINHSEQNNQNSNISSASEFLNSLKVGLFSN